MSADQPTATWYNSFFSDDVVTPKPQLDRFVFRRKLGEGRFGEVWLAFDKQLDREVAIKLAHPVHLPKASDTQVLMVEAKLMAALDHPNIVPVFDVGETSEGRVYIVSRFVDGCDLAARLKSELQDLSFTVTLIAAVAEALDSAHRKGLVHRDIKPANILIEKATQKPYVADFGLAVRDDDVLRSSQLAGTPAYMSPEQAKATGERLDGRSDIFSLGCVLYQMLTGKRPFSGATASDVLRDIIHTEPIPSRSLNNRISKELENICLKAMQKNRSDRFATASEMTEALRQLKDIEPSTDPHDLNVIGPYKIRRKIGEGGMGSVYEADQSKPVRRRVALKVIRSGLNSDEVQKRFEAERQALAMMDHPNIARVLDAGVTDDGRPYFAMELVKGIAITEYCDANKLSLDDRLELFIQTCNAVQHAHQKGIIHRDIKPSNVLVTQEGNAPNVKVIDFGLAKALHATNRLTDQTLITEFGKVMGTLQYMSPEQAEMNALDVDTRSDVYSLGVLLYELLTGSTPLDRKSLKMLALDKVLAAIREQEPPRPSHRLSSLGLTATSISELRKTDTRKLSLILKGDLDWIAMKALEKERTRRYVSAAQFAEDVERFQKNESVIARPPSNVDKLRKAYRRNGLAINAAMIVLLCVFAGFAATTVLWIRLRAADIATRRAMTDSLDSARPDSVPVILESLSTSPQRSLEALAVLQTSDSARTQFRARCCTVALQELPGKLLQTVIQEWDSQPNLSNEHHALVAACRQHTQAAVLELKSRVLLPQSIDRTARLSVVLTLIGERAELINALAVSSDPSLRSEVILQISRLNGFTNELCDFLEEETDADALSGICQGLAESELKVHPEQIVANEYERIQHTMNHMVQISESASVVSSASLVLRRLGAPEQISDILQPKSRRSFFLNPVGFMMVRIPAGRFQMGLRANAAIVSAGVLRGVVNVEMRRPFFIADRETTIGAYRQFRSESQKSSFKTDIELRDDAKLRAREAPTDAHPATHITWDEAIEFCNWLSHKDGRTPCYELHSTSDASPNLPQWSWNWEANGYRLPTQAEWEYACRGCTITDFHFGSDRQLMPLFAIFGTSRLVKGRSLLPNGFGLFDTYGSLYEWCWDDTPEWFRQYTEKHEMPVQHKLRDAPPLSAEAVGELPDSLIDPIGKMAGNLRGVRGGTFWLDDGSCYSGYSHEAVRDHGPDRGFGFRIVCSDIE